MQLPNRHEGCEARLFDDGKKQEVPVCMGGVALVGCNNYEVCKEAYGERIEHPGYVHVIFPDKEGRVRRITSVPRAPLVSPEG